MEKSKRIIGLDIFRIISMLGIIGLHLLNNGGIVENITISNNNYIIVLILLVLCFLSVNSFAVLSGYLLIEKKETNYRRIIELIMIILFYTLVITGVFYAFNFFNVRNDGIITLAKSIFPFGFGYYWYITCYILVFFLSKYINYFVSKINQKQYKGLLILLFIMFSILPNLFLQTDFFKLNNGYSPFWLIFLYFVGGYIKLYPVKISTKKIIVYIIIFLLLTIGINYSYRLICSHFLGKVVRDNWLMDYTSPFNVIISSLLLLLLLLFSRIKFENKLNKIIIYLSSVAFSVYIIHDQSLIFFKIIKNRLIFTNDLNAIIQIIVIIATILTIYLIGAIMDYIRKIIFKLTKADKLPEIITKIVEKKVEKIKYE